MQGTELDGELLCGKAAAGHVGVPTGTWAALATDDDDDVGEYDADLVILDSSGYDFFTEFLKLRQLLNEQISHPYVVTL